MHRKYLKLAIVAAEKRHYPLAVETNDHLPPECHLSEHDITRIVTNRKNPTPEQAAALARVLGCSVVELFPDVQEGGGGHE
jgi:plasmid maintenance system antidote protein VapI